jgi:hypothetical protein
LERRKLVSVQIHVLQLLTSEAKELLLKQFLAVDQVCFSLDKLRHDVRINMLVLGTELNRGWSKNMLMNRDALLHSIQPLVKVCVDTVHLKGATDSSLWHCLPSAITLMSKLGSIWTGAMLQTIVRGRRRGSLSLGSSSKTSKQMSTAGTRRGVRIARVFSDRRNNVERLEL